MLRLLSYLEPGIMTLKWEKGRKGREEKRKSEYYLSIGVGDIIIIDTFDATEDDISKHRSSGSTPTPSQGPIVSNQEFCAEAQMIQIILTPVSLPKKWKTK